MLNLTCSLAEDNGHSKLSLAKQSTNAEVIIFFTLISQIF